MTDISLYGTLKFQVDSNRSTMILSSYCVTVYNV